MSAIQALKRRLYRKAGILTPFTRRFDWMPAGYYANRRLFLEGQLGSVDSFRLVHSPQVSGTGRDQN